MASEDGVAPVISEKTAKFLSMLHGYLDTRKQLDAKYAEEDPDELLAKFDVGAERAKPSYTKELQQQNIAATADADDDDELEFAPLKGKDRAQEKATNDYANRVPGPGVSWLFDIVRGSIKFASTAELFKCMELLMNPEEGSEFRLVKAKNRFQNPTLSGYRDFNVCIQITVRLEDGGSFQHICELQIHHIAIKSLSKLLHSHDYYNFFRTYFEGATESLEELMEVLEFIASGAKLDSGYLTNMVATSTDEDRLNLLIVFFCDSLSEYELAIKACERLLEIRQSRPHEENESPGLAYHQMARTYQFQGNVDKALEYYGKYIDIREEIFGPGGLETAGAYCNMGLIYDQQLGKPEEAFVLYEKSEKGIVEADGPESEDLINVYSNMSSIYQKRGDYDKAVQMCEKAQGLVEKHFGPEHHTVGVTIANTGEFRHKQGRFEEAVELYTRARKLLVMGLGPHHPHVEQVKKRLQDAEAGIKLPEDA